MVDARRQPRALKPRRRIRFGLPTDRAVSLGVIVNELVSNACKYAYPASVSGEIRVSVGADRRGSDFFVLAVEDDGCGIDRGCRAARDGDRHQASIKRDGAEPRKSIG